MGQRQRISLETLLGETEGLRRLASRLVGDAAAADDLVQEAVLAALSSGPAVEKNPAGWLRSTVRNLARQSYRSRAGQAAREAEVAPREALESTSESVIAAERQRVLLEAIMELQEPYREAVLARFIRGLSPRAIAEESGALVPTVKKQIERGLGQLRASLGDRFGEGGVWAVALLPLCREDVRALALKASASGVVVKAGSKFSGGVFFGGVAALALAAVVGAAWYLGDSKPLEEPVSLAQVEPPIAMQDVATVLEPAPQDAVSQRSPATSQGVAVEFSASAAAAETAEMEAAPAPAPSPLSTFVGLDGEPIKNASVTWRPGDSSDAAASLDEGTLEGRTDEEGRLALASQVATGLGEGTWTIDGREFAPMGHRASPDEHRTYLMAPAVRLAGYVRDSSGSAVAGVTVTCFASASVTLKLPVAVREGDFYGDQCSDVSGADGSFDLGVVPGAGMATVTVSSADSQHAKPFATPASDDLAYVFTVRDRVAPKATVAGRVELEGGRACPGAWVQFGDRKVQADSDGRFEVGVPYIGRSWPPMITARDEGGRFGLVEGVDLRVSLQGGGPDIVIVVPSSMGTVSGTLLHSSGRPAKRVMIALMNRTSEGGSGSGLEQVGANSWPSTDHEGRFALSLLRDRAYSVRFYSLDPLMVHDVTIDPGEAGALTITLPKEPDTRSVAGIVVDRDGRPVAGARVGVTVMTRVSPSSSSGSGAPELSVDTDKNGAFLFPSLPPTAIKIGVATQPRSRHLDAFVSIETFDESEPTRIEVDALCEVQLSVADTAVTVFGARDAAGEDVRVYSVSPSGSAEAWWIKRGEGGEFPLLFLPQSTVSLSLRANHKELRSEPVQLRSGEISRLDL